MGTPDKNREITSISRRSSCTDKVFEVKVGRETKLRQANPSDTRVFTLAISHRALSKRTLINNKHLSTSVPISPADKPASRFPHGERSLKSRPSQKRNHYRCYYRYRHYYTMNN